MELEKELTSQEAANLLRKLADALENHQIIHIDEMEINLPKNLDISLEYEEDGDESELEIEFSWTKSDRPSKGKFEIFEGKNGQWYFRLKASNGQTILTSEGYKTKQGAQKGVASVQKNAQAERFEYRTSKAEQAYFVLKAANGEIIGNSQMYKRQASCEKGVRSVINHAPNAEIAIL